MKNSTIITLISLFCLSSFLEARQLFTNLSSSCAVPFANDPYRFYAPTKQKELSPSYDFEFTALGYTRFCDQVYSNESSSSLKDLSALFHNHDTFYFQDLFENNLLPSIGEYRNTDNVIISPQYRMNESGVTIGGTVQKACSFGGEREWRLRCSVQLPIKRIMTENVTQEDAISLTTIGSTKAKDYNDYKKYLYLGKEDGNNVFTARMDVLNNLGLLTIQQEESLPSTTYCTTEGVIIDKVGITQNLLDDDEINNTNITLAQIMNGAFFTCITDGTITVENETTISNITGSSITTPNGIFENKVYFSNPPDKKTCVLPLLVYTSVSDTIKGIAINNQSLVVVPKVIATTKTTAASIYIASRDFTTINGPYPKGTTITIVGYGSAASSMQNTTNNEYLFKGNDQDKEISVNFITPPVAVQRSTDGTMPSEHAIQITLEDNGVDVYGTYPDYEEEQEDYDIYFMKGDGTTTGTDTDTPIIFWYQNDYKDFLTTAPLNKFYLTTSLDENDDPTPASEEIYQAIAEKMEEYTTGTEEILADISLVKKTIKGWNEYPTNNNALEAPNPQWNWNEFSKSGIGDLDCQFLFGSTFYDKKLAADLIIGVTTPTGLTVTPLYNYLAVPLGNNGHYQWRLGGQAAFDLTKWARLSGYCHYSWALPSHEMIISPFANADAYGLQPSTVLANIWWQEFVLSGDLSCFANETTSLALKYQYTLKRQDNISLEATYARSGAGDSELLSPFSLLPNTARRAHKVIGECAIAVNPDCILSFGASEVIAGRNIAREGEFFANIIINF